MKTKNAQKEIPLPENELPMPEAPFYSGVRCFQSGQTLRLERDGKSVRVKLTGRSYKLFFTEPKRAQRSIGTAIRQSAIEGAVAALRHLNRGGKSDLANN